MLVVYPLPDKGYRYPYGVGVDCIIVCKAFGDASFPIIRTCPTLFVTINHQGIERTLAK